MAESTGDTIKALDSTQETGLFWPITYKDLITIGQVGPKMKLIFRTLSKLESKLGTPEEVF